MGRSGRRAVYRFHLRRDVCWHDGFPFTAEDVRCSYATALEMKYHGAGWLGDIEEIVVLDPHTVEMRLASPNVGFLAQLGIFVFTHILPAHLYDGTTGPPTHTMRLRLEPGRSGLSIGSRERRYVWKPTLSTFEGGRPSTRSSSG